MVSLTDIHINRSDNSDGQARDDDSDAPVPPAPELATGGPETLGPESVYQDERRMQGRAYNHWLSLISGSELPAIEDLHLEQLGDMAAHGVLLDLTLGAASPSIIVLGDRLAEECGEGLEIFSIGDVPGRSLLSQLTDHCMEVAGTLAPVGFDAEFADRKGRPILSRGILLPFSSNGMAADFIFGVINWTGAVAPVLVRAPAPIDESALAQPAPAEPAIQLAPNSLVSLLVQARHFALAARSGEERSREALYNAISVTYDFSLAAFADPENFAQLLKSAGLTFRPRSPLAPVVRLIFGPDYDKTRIAEITAALALGHRRGLDQGGLGALLRSAPGGLRALVAEERRLRRIESGTQTGRRCDFDPRIAAKLRNLQSITPISQIRGGEFGLFMARRDMVGGVILIGDLSANAQLLETAARRLLTR